MVFVKIHNNFIEFLYSFYLQTHVNRIDSGQYFTSFAFVYVVYILLHSKSLSKAANNKIDKTKVLKCMFMIFNIFLKSKINISLCTDLIFTYRLFIWC